MAFTFNLFAKISARSGAVKASVCLKRHTAFLDTRFPFHYDALKLCWNLVSAILGPCYFFLARGLSLADAVFRMAVEESPDVSPLGRYSG
jgi:hypothetical protein